MDNQRYGDPNADTNKELQNEKRSDAHPNRKLAKQKHLGSKLGNGKHKDDGDRENELAKAKAPGYYGDLDKKEKFGGDADFGKDLKKCTVLGGRGVIGRALVDRLLSVGKWMVRVADYDLSPLKLQPCEKLLADAISTGRATYFQVDVRHKSQILQGTYIWLQI